VAPDNDEIGKVRPADQLHLDRWAGGHALDMLADCDEPIRLAKGGDGTRAFGSGERPAGNAALVLSARE
jgi:hypothetical protein